MLCGWEGNRRSGVALAMRHRLGGIPTYGLNDLRKGDDQKHKLGEARNETTSSTSISQEYLYQRIFLPTVIKIGQCLTKLQLIEDRDFFETPCISAGSKSIPCCAEVPCHADVRETKLISQLLSYSFVCTYCHLVYIIT